MLIKKVQFNLWLDQEDIDWVRKMTDQSTFAISNNEFIRQLIKEARAIQENREYNGLIAYFKKEQK